MEELNYDSKTFFVNYLGEDLYGKHTCIVNNAECDQYKFQLGIHLPPLIAILLNGGILGVSCSQHLHQLVDVSRDVMIQVNQQMPPSEYGDEQVEGIDNYIRRVEEYLYM